MNPRLRPFIVLTAIVGLIVTGLPTAHAATIYTVTSTADSGTGTLREAMGLATSGDTIAFDIAGAAPYVISPTSGLPDIGEGVTIDGATEPQYVSSPVVQINGSGAGIGVHGLAFTSNDITINGLSVTGYSGNGILAVGGDGLTLTNNYLGIAPDGSAAGNSQAIVAVNTSNALIGGASDGNVMASMDGNSAVISIGGTGTGDVIQGNLIATSPDGLATRPGRYGIIVSKPDVVIGGSNSGEGNIIAGDEFGTGIYVNDGSSATTIRGNSIGVGSDGTTQVGSLPVGIQVDDADGVSIGGATLASGNLIANTSIGVTIAATAATPTIRYNRFRNNPNGSLVWGAGPAGPTSDVAIDTGTGIYVRGSLAGGAASTAYDLDGYTSTSCGHATNPQAGSFESTRQVTTDGSGAAAISDTFPATGSLDATFTMQGENGTDSTRISSCVPISELGATVDVHNTAYTPTTPTIVMGQGVVWNVTSGSHSVTDPTPLGRFDSGIMDTGSSFGDVFNVAGSYSFRCQVHPTQMTGKVAVPMTGVKAGKKFALEWVAGEFEPGEAFDVAVKVPGSRKFKTWLNDTTSTEGLYTPKAGRGKYVFRGRFVNTDIDATSGWSPTLTLKR